MRYVLIALLALQCLDLSCPYSAFPIEYRSGTPEAAVVQYFDAYTRMDWRQAGEYLHPDSLAALKKKILSIIQRTDQKTRGELVEEFGFEEFGKLEALSSLDFYVAANRRLWKQRGVKTPQGMGNFNITNMRTKLIGDGTQTVFFDVDGIVAGRTLKKTYQYSVKMFSGTWKIYLVEDFQLSEKTNK